MNALTKAAATKAAAAAGDWAERGRQSRAALAVAMRQGFDWAYGRAVEGLPGIDGAAALAARYRARHATPDAAVRALIAWHTGMAGVSGFVTGCGGLAALPVALPANLAGALYIQARLIAAIAHLRGHDAKSEEVRAVALACLSGAKAADTVKDAGAQFAARLARDGAGWISPAIFRKARHAAQVSAHVSVHVPAVRGAARFAKFAPLVGGVVAGGFDAAMTKLIGHAADRAFAKSLSRTAGEAARAVSELTESRKGIPAGSEL